MTGIGLRVYRQPGHAEVYLRFTGRHGGQVRLTAVIDTGSHGTMLPEAFAQQLQIRNPRKVWLERAGVPGAGFEAIEAKVMIRVEDELGALTQPFEISVWFAGTLEIVTGFGGLLNRAVLHLDMPNLTGYLDFPDDI